MLLKNIVALHFPGWDNQNQLFLRWKRISECWCKRAGYRPCPSPSPPLPRPPPPLLRRRRLIKRQDLRDFSIIRSRPFNQFSPLRPKTTTNIYTMKSVCIALVVFGLVAIAMVRIISTSRYLRQQTDYRFSENSSLAVKLKHLFREYLSFLDMELKRGYVFRLFFKTDLCSTI